VLQKKKPNETKEEKLNGSFDENDENGHASISGDGNDNSDLGNEDTSPKRNAQRTAKVKVVRYGEYDNEEDEGIIHAMETDDENESDYMGSDSDTEKKIKKANTKPKQPRKPKTATAAKNGTSSIKKKSPIEEDALNAPVENQQKEDESSPKAKTEKPKKPRAKKEPGTTPKKEPVKKEPKKTAKRPKPDDSDDDDFPVLSDPPTPTKKPRTQRGAAAKKSYHISDDEDDDEDYV